MTRLDPGQEATTKPAWPFPPLKLLFWVVWAHLWTSEEGDQPVLTLQKEDILTLFSEKQREKRSPFPAADEWTGDQSSGLLRPGQSNIVMGPPRTWKAPVRRSVFIPWLTILPGSPPLPFSPCEDTKDKKCSLVHEYYLKWVRTEDIRWKVFHKTANNEYQRIVTNDSLNLAASKFKEENVLSLLDFHNIDETVCYSDVTARPSLSRLWVSVRAHRVRAHAWGTAPEITEGCHSIMKQREVIQVAGGPPRTRLIRSVLKSRVRVALESNVSFISFRVMFCLCFWLCGVSTAVRAFL